MERWSPPAGRSPRGCWMPWARPSASASGSVWPPVAFGRRPALLGVRGRIARWPISINSVFSEDTFLEILPQGSSKGAALEFVAQHLGIPLSEIIAVGDNLNDLEMIRTAGLGVAMGNAPPELRAQAGYVTSTNDEGGLAEVIERFILNRTASA